MNFSKFLMMVSLPVLFVCAVCDSSFKSVASAQVPAFADAGLFSQIMQSPWQHAKDRERQKKAMEFLAQQGQDWEHEIHSDDYLASWQELSSDVDSSTSHLIALRRRVRNKDPEKKDPEKKDQDKKDPEKTIHRFTKDAWDKRDWTGGQAWQSKFAPFAEGGNFSFTQGLLSAEDKYDAKIVWARKLSSELSHYLSGNPSILYNQGSVYVIDGSEQVMKFDARSGKMLWKQEFEKKSRKDKQALFASSKSFATPLAMSSNSIFTSNADGTIYKLDAETGKVLWKAYSGHPVRMIKIWQQNIIVMTADNLVLVLSSNDGQLLWRDQGASTAFFGSSSIYTSLDYSEPLVMGDNLIAAFSNGSVSSWKVFNGQKMWNHAFSSNVLSNSVNSKVLTNTDIFDVDASLVRDSHNIYVLSSMEGLFALDYLTGRKIWHLPEIQGFVTPWISNGNLFVISNVDKLVSVDVSTGKVQWERSLRDQILQSVGLSYHTGESASELWKKSKSDTGSKIISNPVDNNKQLKKPMVKLSDMHSIRNSLLKSRPYWFSPIMVNSKLLLVSNTGLVVTLSSDSGDILNIQKLHTGIISQPIVSNGRLFLLSANGLLLALE